MERRGTNGLPAPGDMPANIFVENIDIWLSERVFQTTIIANN
jgi:hypothetical protein